MLTEVLIGLDVGTTWCKAAAVGPDGTLHAVARVATPWRAVPTGAEADPDELFEAAAEACRQALAAVPAGRVVAVGVAGMAEAGVLLDARGRPVAPVIAWHDTRGAEAAQRLALELPEFSSRTGLPFTATCTAVKHAHLVAAGVRGERWLNVPEWVVHRLGGDQVAELSLAARTGYLDVASATWWDAVQAWVGPAPSLPEPVAAGTAAGRANLRELRGAVLTVAGHDHTCAALGAGAAGEGDVLDSCGTAEALIRAVPAPLEPATIAHAAGRGLNVGRHVVPGSLSLVAGFPSGRLLVGVDINSPAAEPVLAALASKAATLLTAMDEIAGRHRRLVVTGGWARHEVFRRYRARALGRFELAGVEEAGIAGAARLAAVAAGFEQPAVAG